MPRPDAREVFAAVVAVPDERIDLLQGALAIALDEEPHLDLEAERIRFDALARRGLEGLPPLAPDHVRLARLDALLFEALGIDGRGCDFGAPESSFVHHVVTRRTGLPIALAVVWVEVGRRMGLRCEGVNFPGHFLAKVALQSGDRVVDPFHRGRVVSDTELERRLSPRGGPRRPIDRSLLGAAPARQILARMLRNLKNLYLRRGDLPRAFSAVDRLLLATPDVPDDVRDRGLLCARLGGVAAARRDLERYLALRPDAPDAARVRATLAELGVARTLLN